MRKHSLLLFFFFSFGSRCFFEVKMPDLENRWFDYWPLVSITVHLLKEFKQGSLKWGFLHLTRGWDKPGFDAAWECSVLTWRWQIPIRFYASIDFCILFAFCADLFRNLNPNKGDGWVYWWSVEHFETVIYCRYFAHNSWLTAPNLPVSNTSE